MDTLRNSKGVTVLEFLVAAIIAGILLTAALPSLSAAIGSSGLQSAIRTTTGHVRVVRATAVARNALSRLVVDGAGSTLSTEVFRDGTWQAVGGPTFLEGVAVSAVSPPSGIVFSSQGTTNAAATITLRNTRGDTATVRVSLLGMVEAG